MTSQEEVQDVEKHGRGLLLRRATQQDALAKQCHAKAEERHPSKQAPLRKLAQAHERNALDCRERATDTRRYLWLIEVSGYGEFHWVGTPASAEGRRALKARQEGATAKATQVRQALPTEADGEWTEPQPTPATSKKQKRQKKPMGPRALKTYERKQQALCDAWEYPEGTPVTVRKDGGEVVQTTTRSMPWLLGGTAVILVDGISGGYSLERVRPVSP